jgi:asparagine synthase (glutamine-hydrolysing)
MRHGLRKPRWSGQDLFRRMHRPLVRPEIKEEALRDEALIHPLFRGSPTLPPGKLEQAYLLAFQAARFHNPSIAEEHPIRVDPLSAQPLIELSLRIPLYVLLTGGRDRSIARYAFAEDVPREIILRKTKAHGGDWVKETLACNISLARELLLDGYLTREGYLDRAKVEEALSGQPTRLKTYGSEILGYLNIEAWAQNWVAPRHGERRRACGPQGS